MAICETFSVSLHAENFTTKNLALIRPPLLPPAPFLLDRMGRGVNACTERCWKVSFFFSPTPPPSPDSPHPLLFLSRHLPESSGEKTKLGKSGNIRLKKVIFLPASSKCPSLPLPVFFLRFLLAVGLMFFPVMEKMCEHDSDTRIATVRRVFSSPFLIERAPRFFPPKKPYDCLFVG